MDLYGERAVTGMQSFPVLSSGHLGSLDLQEPGIYLEIEEQKIEMSL